MARAIGVSLSIMAVLYICVIQGARVTAFRSSPYKFRGSTYRFHNQCPFTVWPIMSFYNGTQLDSGQWWTVQYPDDPYGIQVWARTDCYFGKCRTGDCGPSVNCLGLGMSPNATVAKFSHRVGAEGYDGAVDYYGISLVDGFNLPISIIPSDSQCKPVECSSNITANCPSELTVTGGCMSPCSIFNTSQYCCATDYYYSNNCSRSNYSRFFEKQCPQASSYAKDDTSKTLICPSGTNYTVIFCGSDGSEVSSFVLRITISGAVIMALALMVVIAVYWKKYRINKHLNEDCLTIMLPNSTKFRAFTLEEIMESTQNFNEKVGQGGFGSVFFGKLVEGRDIAVKVLSLFSIEGVHQFQNEVNLLSKIHHKNLVSLLGFCNESKQVMLIYEHMSEGSLRDHLHGHRAEISPLNWMTRLKIALDAAQGLEYLHMGCTPKIIHRDVKTANILLDGNMNGKLADFGLSRITLDGEASYANTTVKGTIGYLDPEYFRTQMLTEKSDVYSFGVVLFEIICGRPPINTNLVEEEVNLIQWVTPYVRMDENAGNNIEVIIDKRLDGNYDIISVEEVARLAFKCVDAKPSCRPSVSEVVSQIKENIIREKEKNNPLPISEGIGIEHRDFQPRMESIPRKMEWADNSSNLPQVGR